MSSSSLPPGDTTQSPEGSVFDAATPGRSARYDRRKPGVGPSVSVILPTFNEAKNLPVLTKRLEAVLLDLDYEIIVVDDDSPDLTWQVGEELATHNPRIHVVRRVGARGLSSAVMAGFAMAKGRTLAVLDADLQHDERILPDLVSAVLDDGKDIAVGSREVEGGSYGTFGPGRRFVSWGGAMLARLLLKTPVADPMSGFFVVSRERYHEVVDRVNPRGFKILLEFLANGPAPRVTEVGYSFSDRLHGSTKLTGSVAAAYLLALIELVAGRFVTATFSAYALVGTSGLAVRALAYIAASQVLASSLALWFALELSILWNFGWNNRFTFNAYRLVGAARITGLAKFHLVAAHGALVAWAGQTVLLREWPFAETRLVVVAATGAGILLATAGNFHLNRSITWSALRS